MSRMRAYWSKEVDEQERWIEKCGGSLAGYVANYGSAGDPDHYGSGGEAIWQADSQELARLKRLAGRT